MSTYSTYYTIMSMIDGFKSFINLAVMVLTIVASWIMYAKAGEHGWAAIVPFYSSYVKFRIAGKQKLFWGYLVASIASIAGFACGLIFLNVIFICIIAFNKNIVYVGDGYNSNNNYYNPYGSNGYGQQYGQNMYGNGANQQYGQNMYGNGANQQYGQNMYGNGANQQYGQNMYGNGTNQQYGQNMYGNGANQQYGQNPYGTAQGGDAQNSYGTSQQQSWNDEYNNKDYE